MWHRTAVLATALALAAALSAPPTLAQQEGEEEAAEMMEAWQQAGQPGQAHQHLAQLVGKWQAETKFWMQPDAEPMVSEGTIEYRMIMNGRYLEERVDADFMGQPFKGMGLYGYSNVNNELQAVWVDDMSTTIYSYSGSVNEAGDKMVLKGKYKDPASGEWKENRSVMRIVSPNELHYVGYEMADGEERKVMEIKATRMSSGTGTGSSDAR